MPVPARINFANDFSPKFVGRDSAQVATRLANGCTNAFGTPAAACRSGASPAAVGWDR